MIFNQTRIVGSAVGNRKDAIETMEMASRGIVKTHFTTCKMDEVSSVFEKMDKNQLQGRVVVELAA